MLTTSLCLSLLLLQAPRDRVPGPDAAPPTGTAVISGRVTARDSGQPLRRAVVTLFGQVGERRRDSGGAESPRRRVHRTVRTNSEGRFEFAGLPAGSYRVLAAGGPHRSHYLPLNYAARSAMDIGKSIELAEGQRVQAHFALQRGGTLSGRVLDDTGEPVSQVTVGPVRVSRSGTFEPVGHSDQSDDQGRFRIYGLQPGEYVVTAEARDQGPEVEGRPEGFAVTYFPSAVSEHEAARVRVGLGDEAADLEIVLVRTRTFRITGSLTDSSGAPVTRANVSLLRVHGSGYTFGAGVSMSGDGLFSINNVIAGNYLLSVRPTRDPDAPPDTIRRREFALVPLSVDADVQDLVVTTQPGTTITGRVSFAEGTPAALPEMTVFAQTSDRLPSVGSTPQSTVGADLRFTLTDLFGHYSVRPAGLPHGYTLKAVLLGGTDITSTDVEFKPEHNGQLVVVLTSRASVIEGAVTDASGQPASEVSIVLLPEDKSSWSWGNMRTRVTFGSDGRYRLEGILPGRYYIVAVPRDVARPSRADGLAVFEPFLKDAVTVVLNEDETRTVDLRAVK